MCALTPALTAQVQCLQWACVRVCDHQEGVVYEPGRPKVAILANRLQLGSSSAAGESHSELFYLLNV